MIFRVRAKALSNLGEIMGWLADNASDDQYRIDGTGGVMLIVFSDEQLAVQCKLAWSELMEVM